MNQPNQEQATAAAPSNNGAQHPQFVQASVYQPQGMLMPEATAYRLVQANVCRPHGNGLPAPTTTIPPNAHNPAPPTAGIGVIPKKYVKINGVARMNPEYVIWRQSQAGAGTTTSLSMALPVISCMEDHVQLNDDLGTIIRLSEATDASIEIMQDSQFCADAGMGPDTMVDELCSVLSKYEVPMGLMNKVRRCTAKLTLSLVLFPLLNNPPFTLIYQTSS